MKNTPTILSTKLLSPSQKELLLNAGVAYVEYNSIHTSAVAFTYDGELITNAIFTSKNAVKAVASAKLRIQHCYCVGEKTRLALEELGFQVQLVADSASELAKGIIEHYADQAFHFFCGNIRRDELPHILQEHNISITETVVYKTLANLKSFERQFDGVLFFSPSGVKSYVASNYVEASRAFCIGPTTAADAQWYTDHVIIAKKPTIENVIVQVSKYFKNEL
ncbi:uroporphyrinogen-III synthase [Aquimarina brevivitae]|uniref:Uroporphyrinogen-III synthase n=1 Tax=Aquimarina brevivitae TaxID=323412 RepID=A0A4Q7PHA7_9FLAO|nr:uroporphyrinogen-III synthase [Aquimarina brevivitae]RZS99170.1 uroporphyrinogen-III synthase [Aquimarina brevivitae]